MKVLQGASVLVSILNNEMSTFKYSARIMSLSPYYSNYQLFTSLFDWLLLIILQKKCGVKRTIEKKKY